MPYHWHYDYPKIARDSGFLLKQCKDGILDWRLIGSMDIDRLIQEQNFDRIDTVVAHLSEAPLSSVLDTNILDNGIVKYFVLSQLAIQYLLFCKKFLDETVTTLRESLCESQMENLKFKKLNQENSNELLQLHKKLQHMETINEVVYPCSMCTKNFISNDLLNVHMKRKHAKGVSPVSDVDKDNDRNLINTIKLELEIKQLKERLNIAEKDIRQKHCDVIDDKDSAEREKRNSGTQSEPSTRNIGIQSNLNEEKEADDSVEVGNNDALIEIQEKISEFEDWKKSETETNQKSITEIQGKLHEIVESLDGRTQKDVELFKGIVSEAISTIPVEVPVTDFPKFEDLEKILDSAVVKMKEQNSDQLNVVVQRIENSYEEKLKGLRDEIHKQNDVITKGLAASREHLASLSGSRDQLDVVDSSLRKGKRSPDSISIDKPRMHIPENIQKALSSNDESGSSETETEESSQETSSESELNEKETLSRQFPEEKVTTIVRKKREKAHPPPKSFKRRDAIRMTETRLKAIGIPANTRSLSAAMAKDVAADLLERRGSIKKKHPNFYATRNKLKKFVERLITDQKPKKQSVELRKPEKVEHPTPSIRQTDTSHDEFKMRLEKILGSPMHKPKAFSTPTEVGSENKPIPLPRKRVMFDFPMNKNPKTSGDKTALSSDEHETSSNVSSLI